MSITLKNVVYIFLLPPIANLGTFAIGEINRPCDVKRLYIVNVSSTVKFNDEGDLILTTAEMGKIFNMRADTLSDWAKKGCPKEERGWWNVKKVIEWRGMSRLGDNVEMSSEAKKLQADADYKTARARQAEVELQEQLGRLVPIEIVKEQMQDAFAEIRQLMLKLPNDIHAKIHVAYPNCAEDVKEIADDTVRKCLLRLAECDNARGNANVGTDNT